MDKFDRFQRFHRILTTRRRPVPLMDLAKALECSSKTVQRTIEQMRDYWQAPIEYSREHKGYYYSDRKFALPGLWLTTGELQSLTFLLSVIEEIDEGLLHDEVSTVMQHLQRLLAARNIDQAELARRDGVILVRRDILEEQDGPMLQHGLQGLHQLRLNAPTRISDRPDPERLGKRFEEFLAAQEFTS